MGSDELAAIRALEQRIEAVGSIRGGVLQEIQRHVVSLESSFRTHTAADERGDQVLTRELAGIRTALEAMQEAMMAQSDSIATLRERSMHHGKMIDQHQRALQLGTGGGVLGGALFVVGKLAGWF